MIVPGIAIVLVIVLSLGLIFLGINKRGRASLRRRAPWFVGAGACVVATLTLSTYDDGIASLFHPVRRHQLRDMLLGGCVMAVMASEAVFISRWALATLPGKATAYLIVFTGTTLFAWFLTLLALWPIMPGS